MAWKLEITEAKMESAMGLPNFRTGVQRVSCENHGGNGFGGKLSSSGMPRSRNVESESPSTSSQTDQVVISALIAKIRAALCVPKTTSKAAS